MSKTLFLSPPSFDGFDGGAGSRYQARREVTSFWYPTWLAQPAALVPDVQHCEERIVRACSEKKTSASYGRAALHFRFRDLR